jgi:hypothetical protein
MIAATHSTGQVILDILVMVAVIVTGVMGSMNQMRARRNRSFDMRMLAARLQFEDFNPAHDESFAMGWGFLSRLSQGEKRFAFNLMRGTYHEQHLYVFDYHCQIGSGKNKREHELTALMLVCREAFPQVTITPGGEGILSKMAAAFGVGDDIQFESAEFSRVFRVQSRDKRFAYDVCNPQMIEYLLANRDLGIEIQGPVILLSFEPLLPVGEIEFNLQRLVEIRSRLPEYLFTDI